MDTLEEVPVPVSLDYCYNVQLVNAIMTHRSKLSLKEVHRINNLVQLYRGFSGYYGTDIPVQKEKADAIREVFEEMLGWNQTKIAA